MSSVYGYLLALLIGAGGGFYVEHLRWVDDVQQRDVATAQAIAANVDAVNQHLVKARDETEQIRTVFIQDKANSDAQITALQSDVDAKRRQLRISAACTTVQPTGTSTGGATSGTAELDPTARQAYFNLRRGLADQYTLLKLCRSELTKRSAAP